MLKTCVLLELDWVDPMMQFLFARHNLMHISCIHTSYFLSFGTLYNGAFLFPSLSLSLSDRLHMAPKRKSTPSWNPLRSGTSFSNPTPLHVQFRDEKTRKDFSKNFSKHGVHSKCGMILSDFSDTTTPPTIIHNRGWESLSEIPVSCPTMIIQEFYSNMHDFDTSISQFITHIRGTCIVVTPDLISDILYVLRVVFLDYPGCPRLRTVSKDELLSLFCETPSS